VLYSLYAFVVNETAYPFDTVIIVALIAAACALFGIQRQRIREQRNQLWFFTLIIIGGIVFTSLLTTFISRHTSFIYTPSRTFFVLPFVYYIIAIVYGAIARPFLRYLFLSALLMAQLYGIGNLAANRHFLMPTYAVPWKTIMADLNGKGGYITADETELYRYYAEQLGGAYPVPINNEGIVDTALVTSTEFPLYTLIFGRESTSVQIDSAGLAFIERNYAARSVIEYLPIDESYRKVKQKFLKRDAYKAKVTLTGYSRRQ
jgi:hypothetical protein